MQEGRDGRSEGWKEGERSGEGRGGRRRIQNDPEGEWGQWYKERKCGQCGQWVGHVLTLHGNAPVVRVQHLYLVQEAYRLDVVVLECQCTGSVAIIGLGIDISLLEDRRQNPM